MKDKGFIVAFGNTNGAPILYSFGSISRAIRILTVGAGAAAALFSAGYLIGKIKRIKLF